MTTELSLASLPTREGPRPKTTPTNPHMQLDQNAPVELQERVADFMFSRACIAKAPSRVAPLGTRAMLLEEACEAGPQGAFMVGREFCHIHPPNDGSLHLNLPLDVGKAAIENGWAEPHPLAVRGYIPPNVVMVYGPRNDHELDVVTWLVEQSYQFAHPTAAAS